MDQQNFEKLVVNVSQHFPTPEALIGADDLSREQKLELLRQWEYDLHLMQVATEENMTGDTPPGANAEKIRAVHAAAEKLGAELDPEGSGAAKTGAVIKEK
ncbi:MAG TPA: hypothetical protein VFE34_22935 [Dongiaceae bacterium]|jgi:hypothetical protein|nr:hypothetical protein [Dongiaceae bacterium]